MHVKETDQTIKDLQEEFPELFLASTSDSFPITEGSLMKMVEGTVHLHSDPVTPLFTPCTQLATQRNINVYCICCCCSMS